MSVANQDIIKIAARKPYNSANLFARVHIDALQLAMNNLKGETFKFWMYLNKNQDNYEFDLSQKACLDWGIKKDAYYTAKNKLIEEKYLVPIKEGSNIYMFYEIPHTEEGKEEADVDENTTFLENRKEFSEKPKNSSEKPKNFSEKPKDFSEKPQRNTINTINTTYTTIDTTNEEAFSADAEKSSRGPEEKEQGSFENPIEVEWGWLAERCNSLTQCANGSYRYGDKFYKMKGE